MTDAMLPIVLGSMKALVLLVAAAGVTLALRHAPARLRAMVWTTALAGSLLIPVVAEILPSFFVPFTLPSLSGERLTGGSVAEPTTPVTSILPTPADRHHKHSTAPSPLPSRTPDLQTIALMVWLVGFAAIMWRLGADHLRMASAVRRAALVTDNGLLDALTVARRRIECPRNVRLVVSREVCVPATVGMWRPVIILPVSCRSWDRQRRHSVLLHELIHIVRFDWPVRIIARIARAAYWFNPVTWWAVRRLDLEQELACDEEVLSHGGRPSSYACHLLAIARSISTHPTTAISGLAMARRSHLEERIMTMLNRTNHRKVGSRALFATAILMAAMVPAIAAVYPGDPPPRPASPELKQIITEMNEVERRLEPHIERIEQFEIEIAPEIEINEEAIAEIEARMQPHLERIEAMEFDMEPYHDEIAALEDRIEDLVLHMEDGTLEEVQRQIQEQLAVHMEQIEAIHMDMEPLHELMEELHVQMEPLHEEMEKLHVDMEPFHREMEKLHEHMEELHVEMEPLHEEMELLGDRLETALETDVEAELRDHLGAVTTFSAPFDEAASRIVEDASIRVNDDIIRIRASRREVREILTDLMKPHMVGLEEAFEAAVDNAADALSPLEITID